MAEFRHVPVLAAPMLSALAPRDGGVYLDGTLGGGNHAELILVASAPTGFLLGIDRDDDALAAATQRLAPFGARFRAVKGNYAELDVLAREAGVAAVDGILLDIGVSSYQLDAAERGFSYMQDAPLDMRMDRGRGPSAAELVNTAARDELEHILYAYGEEKWAARIARFIVERRTARPIATTGELVEIIKQAIPAGAREKDQHPAKRSFQALRIWTNGELEALSSGIDAAIGLLKPGGKLAIVTFHSLEDRIVKEKFRYHAAACLCPPRQPVCTCGHRAAIELDNRRPITATAEEREANPRSRSAKLRVAIKL